MTSTLIANLAEHYQWQLSLVTAISIFAVVMLIRLAERLNPTLRAAAVHNKNVYNKKMERPSYAANHRWNRKWSLAYLVVIFGMVLPFALSSEAQPWWQIAIDIFVILMVYDFFYYLTHRFVFHDSAFFGGPLLWMHAVHHRQHNPCRNDSSFIHPLEVAIGLGLYVATIYLLSFIMGNFHVATVVLSWVAFTEINTHNHHLWNADRFPFRYMHYASRMHHNHHKSFNGGNFATITLLYDKIFGTMDEGEGWKKPMHQSEDLDAI